MDFFTAQEAARKRTAMLVALFGAAVLAIIAVVYVVVHVSIGPGTGPIDLYLLLMVTAGVGAVVGIGSAVRTASLRQGGPAVAELLSGRRVAPDTSDLEERTLLNVVEEMAIASGTPVPAVYVLDGEDGINAFAAGYTTHDAAVAVTRGALRSLSRDELQGVIAHEFSHILNGDMRLNIRLIGVLYGILLLAVIGRGILYIGPRGGGRRGGRDGGAGWIVILGLALFLVGYIGVFFGRLIKAGVSRQREYLADSAAVEFTRNPAGLAGALKKIGAQASGSRIGDHHAEELSHLFFANGLGASLFGFLSTHPPLEERIRRLDPAWQGALDAGETEPGLAGRQVIAPRAHGLEATIAPAAPYVRSAADGVVAAGQAAPGRGPASAPPRPASHARNPPGGGSGSGAQPRESGFVTEPANLIASIGAPSPEHLAYATALLESLPEALTRAAHEPIGAVALVLTMALAETETEGEPEAWRLIRGFGTPALEQRVRDLMPLVRAQGADARLPLLDLALPALQTRSPVESDRLRQTVEQIVRADGRVRLFEFAMTHILARRLEGPDRQDRGGRRTTSFAPLRSEAQVILSAVAWAGSGWEAGPARAAFAAAIRHLPSDALPLQLADPATVSIEQVDSALTRFEHAAPAVQRRLLEACAECAAHDGKIERVEIELLRAVAEALDCPMPPILA